MRIRSALIAGFVAAIPLAGCATPAGDGAPAPVPTLSDMPSASPTPSLPPLPPIPEPGPGTIVVGGQALTIYPKDGSGHYDLDYSLPSDEFIDALSVLFGARPVETTVERQGDCSPPYTLNEWTGVGVVTDFEWLPNDANVEFFAMVPSEAGITIVSSLGIGVGDDSTAVSASLPPEYQSTGQFDEGLQQSIYFDITPIEDSEWGLDAAAFVGSMDGIVYVVDSPLVAFLAEGC